MQFQFPLLVATACLALAACGTQPSETPDATGPAASETPNADPPTPEATENVSILRPDIAPPQPEATQAALTPLNVVVGFPDNGNELSEEAVAKLEDVLASDQFARGLPFTLRAHSDSKGSDAANLKASEGRGLAVAKWFIDKGVDEDRITVIAFGEQNPIKPNARIDGTPDEIGRAANRRVEIEVPALVLTVSTSDDGAASKSSSEAGD